MWIAVKPRSQRELIQVKALAPVLRQSHRRHDTPHSRDHRSRRIGRMVDRRARFRHRGDSARLADGADRRSARAFESIERRFAPQARVTVILAGVSGLYLLIRLDLWTVFAELRFWWLDAMVLFWLLFSLLLFVLEPNGFLKQVIRGNPDRAWARMERLHRVLLAVALIIVAGAVSGSHGF